MESFPALPAPWVCEHLPPLRHGFWLQSSLCEQHWVRACLSCNPDDFLPWTSSSSASPLITTASRQPSKPWDTTGEECKRTRPPRKRSPSGLRPWQFSGSTKEALPELSTNRRMEVSISSTTMECHSWSFTWSQEERFP